MAKFNREKFDIFNLINKKLTLIKKINRILNTTSYRQILYRLVVNKFKIVIEDIL